MLARTLVTLAVAIGMSAPAAAQSPRAGGRAAVFGRPESLPDPQTAAGWPDVASTELSQVRLAESAPPVPTPRPIDVPEPDVSPPPSPPPSPPQPPPPLPVPLADGQPGLPPVVPSLGPFGSCAVEGFDCEADVTPDRVVLGFEWLYWASTGQPLPPLATVAPPGIPATTAGVPGEPGRGVLVGGGRANGDARSGFRFNATWWLDDDRYLGLRADFFLLGTSHDLFTARSNGAMTLARPLVDASTGLPTASPVALPGVAAGRIRVDARSEVIGGGLGEVVNLTQGPAGRLDCTIGYRYLNVRDRVIVREDTTTLADQPGQPAGTASAVTDRFHTANQFHGGTFGLEVEWGRGRWDVGAKAAVAVGVSRQAADLLGDRIVVLPGGARRASPDGLLVRPSNAGRYTHDRLAVLPEVGLRAGFRLSDRVRLTAGYNALYLSRVIRAGGLIDLRIDSGSPQLPSAGSDFPAYAPATTAMWLRGVNFGLEWSY